MSKEFERKFILDRMPTDIVGYIIDRVFIKQDYLAITEDEEVRIRKMSSSFGDVYFHTIKQGSGLERDEFEVRIKKETYRSLLPIDTVSLCKDRFIVKIDGVKMEIDCYESELNDLTIVEVEFDTAQEAVNFTPPLWLGEDVTNDKHYKNHNLWKKINGLEDSE